MRPGRTISLQGRAYHRFGIFSTVSGNLVPAWLFQLWKGASYRIFWKCHKNQMLSRFHQLGEDQMRSHGRAPVAAWHEHQQEEELEDQDGGWWGTWSWVRPDCWVHRARSWAGELLEIKASRQRNQTVKKGSAFGFLEGGRELNYNLHLINRKKMKISS